MVQPTPYNLELTLKLINYRVAFLAANFSPSSTTVSDPAGPNRVQPSISTDILLTIIKVVISVTTELQSQLEYVNTNL